MELHSSLRYMEGAPFYRVDREQGAGAFAVQFGYRGVPAVDQCWDQRQASNDTWRAQPPGNTRGSVTFAMGSAPTNPNCSSAEYCAQVRATLLSCGS